MLKTINKIKTISQTDFDQACEKSEQSHGKRSFSSNCVQQCDCCTQINLHEPLIRTSNSPESPKEPWQLSKEIFNKETNSTL